MKLSRTGRGNATCAGGGSNTDAHTPGVDDHSCRDQLAIGRHERLFRSLNERYALWGVLCASVCGNVQVLTGGSQDDIRLG